MCLPIMCWRRRKETDITELLMRGFQVVREDGLDTFEVVVNGVGIRPYDGGVWRVRVDVTPQYPFEPPNLYFVNPIFHPNINFLSGLICSVCLYSDHIDHGWSPTDDDLVSIFEYWIPRLLIDPNPMCSENHDAAVLLRQDERQYNQLVREFCEMFANVGGMLSENSSGDEESGSEESTSEEGSG